jgi:hypothetical protein
MREREMGVGGRAHVGKEGGEGGQERERQKGGGRESGICRGRRRMDGLGEEEWG